MDDDIELEIEESGQEFGVGVTVGTDDQLMEEGELSDNDDLRLTHLGGGGAGRRKNIQDRLGPRVNFASKTGDGYDMSQKILPASFQRFFIEKTLIFNMNSFL